MKLGIVLIAIGVGDIALTIGLGITSGFSLIRFVIDIALITWGIIRIRRCKTRGTSSV